MELTYRLTRDDHMQCCKLAQERVVSQAPGLLGWRRASGLFPLAWLALVLLMLAVMGWVTGSGVIDGRTLAVVCIAYIVGLCSMQLCGWFWQRQYWANWLPDDSSTLNESRLALDGDGLVCSDATKTTRYSWRAFGDVTEQAGMILLWFDRAQCLVVPARVLAGDDARRDFITLVRERIAQAAAARRAD